MSRLLLPIVALGLSACVLRNPATGQGSSGGALRVSVENESYSYATNDVVGATTITNAHGARTRIVQSKVRHHTDVLALRHDYHEGDRPIDEQDFFRLAGDRESLERVREHRAGASRLQRIGRWLIGGSLVVAGAMVAGGLASDSKPLWVTGVSVPYLPIIFGSVFIASGRSSMRRSPVIEVERARAAADEVEECAAGGGSCRARPGGRRFRRATSLEHADRAW